MKGEAPTIPGVPRRVSASAWYSWMGSELYFWIRRCGVFVRIFSRRSSCSPFITLITMTSAATPTNTPPIAIHPITEMRPRLRFELR